MEQQLPRDEETDLYTRLIELIGRIADYILNTENILKERIGDIMGGKVLELETDKILEYGIEQGIERGIEQGIERGIEQGIERGIEQTTSTFVTRMLNQNMSIEDIILYTGCSRDDILRIKEKAEKQHTLSPSEDTSKHKPPKS